MWPRWSSMKGNYWIGDGAAIRAFLQRQWLLSLISPILDGDGSYDKTARLHLQIVAKVGCEFITCPLLPWLLIC